MSAKNNNQDLYLINSCGKSVTSGGGTSRNAGSFTVYLAASGNDNNSGITPDKPIATWEKAISIFRTKSYDEFILNIADDVEYLDISTPIKNEKINDDQDNIGIDLTRLTSLCNIFRFLGSPITKKYSAGGYTASFYDALLLGGETSTNFPGSRKSIIVSSTTGYEDVKIAYQTYTVNNTTYNKYYPIASVESDRYRTTQTTLNESLDLYICGGASTPFTKLVNTTTAGNICEVLADCHVIFERLEFTDVSEDINNIEIVSSYAPSLKFIGCIIADNFSYIDQNSGEIYVKESYISKDIVLYNSSNITLYKCLLTVQTTSTITIKNCRNIIVDTCIIDGYNLKFLDDTSIMLKGTAIISDVLLQLDASKIVADRVGYTSLRCEIDTNSTYIDGNGSSDYHLSSPIKLSNLSTLIFDKFNVHISIDHDNIAEICNKSTFIIKEVSGYTLASNDTLFLLRGGSVLITPSGLTNSGTGSNVYRRGTLTAVTTLSVDDTDTSNSNSEASVALLSRTS